MAFDKEFEDGLAKISEAMLDLKHETQRAHQLLKDLKHERKATVDQLEHALQAQIAAAWQVIETDLRKQMQNSIESVIRGIEDEWRAALGLPVRK